MKRVSLNELADQGVSHNAAIRKKVMVHPGDIPHLTNFSQATFPPGQIAHAHAHSDMYEVFFVAAGTGTMTINGTDHALVPGVCMLVDPGDVHEINNTGEDSLVLTYFGIV